MDISGIKNTVREYIKKYRYVLLVVLAGMFFMFLPESKEAEQPLIVSEAENIKSEDLQTSLSRILSKLDGAGKVEVLLTTATGETVIYQTDDDESISEVSRNLQTKTVTISGTNREEVGLVRQVNPPIYLGAVVLCQGADDAGIRLSIVEAVMRATGLTSDHISVLKMK